MKIPISAFLFVLTMALEPAAPAQDPPTARIADATPATIKAIVKGWPECDEYLSKDRCKVTVNLGVTPDPDPDKKSDADQAKDKKGDKHGPLMPHAHWDVQVKPFVHLRHSIPRGEAAVLLTHSSPFMMCTAAAVPAAPVRDLSANIGSLLTAAAGLGAVPVGPGAAPLALAGPSLAAQALGPKPPHTGDAALDDIIDQNYDLDKELTPIEEKIPKSYSDFRDALKKNWKYTFPSDTEARAAIVALKAAAKRVGDELDSFTGLAGKVSVLDSAIAKYEKDHTNPRTEFRREQETFAGLKKRIDLLKAHIADFGDQQKTVLQVKAYLDALPLPSNDDPYTIQALPMAYFSGKSATETITCKDAITKDQVFDNIIFTAYYEVVPHLDVSIGVIGSLLGGRQVGTITAPFAPLTTQQAATCTAAAMPGGTPAPFPCAPSTILGYKTRSDYQFMPGVFVEWRWKNFHCPWAENGQPWHPGGYVCSVGAAGGVAINPNNGGPSGEFFEGISIGVQRFSFLIGVHNGRYQEYGGGFYAGETFTPGTTVTPPTAYGWATHPAFAIAYRIPLR